MVATFIREASIEAALRTETQRLGAYCLKITAGGGWPDRIILWPGGCVSLVELKRPRGGGLSARQAALHEQLRQNGFPVSVIATYADIQDFLLLA